jgi:hypothetical protein
MIIGPNDPMPPLSEFPPETQELWMRILLKGARNMQERLEKEEAEREAVQ